MILDGSFAPALVDFVRDTVVGRFGRRRAVVGVSGGIDSAVTVALCARALGPENVTGIALPERENSESSTSLAVKWCRDLGVESVVDDITAALEGLGCYEMRDKAVKSVIADYDPHADQVSVRIEQDMRGARMPALYEIIVAKASGALITRRPTGTAYRELFAASNYKQRLRTVKLYHYAEMRDACVIGTSNLDEEYLGFFVKIGDGTWDACPLESLTKTEVRHVAHELGVPDEIIGRPTTTDTFPGAEQSQEEMFYVLPFDELDVLLEVLVGRRSEDDAISALGWSPQEVETALHNLRRRHRATSWNRLQAVRPASGRPNNVRES